MKARCTYYVLWLSLNLLLLFRQTFALPKQGQWSFTVTQDSSSYVGVTKSLYKNSVVSVNVACTPGKDENSEIKIGFMMRQTPCFEEYLLHDLKNFFEDYYACPYKALEPSYKAVRYLKTELTTVKCTHAIVLTKPNVTFLLKETQDCPRYSTILTSNNQQEGGFAYRNTESKADSSKVENLPKPLSQLSGLLSANENRAKRDVAQSATSAETKANLTNVPKSPKISVDSIVPTNTGEESKVQTSTPEAQAPLNPTRDLIVVDQDGVYLFVIFVVSTSEEKNFSVTFDISLKGPHGYLSAVDWPLLPFYAVMCGIYVIYAVIWLTVSALHWRELLRIQFWIGGVILLGLIEKTVFYGEYQYINSTGRAGHGGMLFAEVLSCLKRTLARLLVIIVSLGFGIVKPRLGPALHRIIGVGALYFTLCSVEGCLRVIRAKNDPGNQTLLAGIPLAVLDSGICWWIFSSLVHTTRTLKLRRNVVKLSLYRHFTNTLVFSVLASVVYMTWTLYNHKLTNCLTDWKELWVDDAYWHLLFSLLLMVIMILWRPTNNNQRYAFTPLLDTVDEEEEDLLEKESSAMNDVYGMKVRGAKNPFTSAAKKDQKNGIPQDDDLKWVDENIPSSLTDTALPRLLDSDEEIMTVRFERNKME